MGSYQDFSHFFVRRLGLLKFRAGRTEGTVSANTLNYYVFLNKKL